MVIAVTQGLNAVEARFLLWLGEKSPGGWLDALAAGLSWLGDGGRVFIALAAVLLCFRRTRRAGAVLAIGLALDALVINVSLKPLFGRARPYEFLRDIHIIIPPPHGPSFPSGHTAVAFAAAGALRGFGRKIFAISMVFAVLMGLSRVYLMVHYPSDVLAGAALGFACGVAAGKIWEMIENKYSKENE